MNEQEELEKQISDLEAQLKPLQQRQRELREQQSNEVEKRIKLSHAGKGDFKLNELRFAAFDRCSCGAGMAYPVNISPSGSWDCSAILRGLAEAGSTHSSSMPFAFWEVKSEDQPSANGHTTRPVEESPAK